ncbi:MAG TPA: phospholipid carrier-dependent glycosyltransferase [Candidatus Binatia bacterium]|nr:phospholipid carrier-dependent glycosyltransferase [Candidatus Binatia bacterium]
MRGIPLGVALVAIGLYLVGLGAAPFLDPPEGVHAEIAREMRLARDWITPRIDGVRYVDQPPLLHWLVSVSFGAAGVTPFAARLWPALATVGCAVLTARLGVALGGPRLGLLAGLMVAANLGVFVYGRTARPELPFVCCVTLAWAGFVLAYLGDRRRGLALFYAALGLAMLTRDFLDALLVLPVIAVFFWLTRERPVGPWIPWWGILITVAIAVPWYVLIEARNPGVLRHMVVDNHLYALTRARLDEGASLGPLGFLNLTVLGFLPWALVTPWAFARAFRRPWPDARARLWLLLGLWSAIVIGVFTLIPFRLPHHALVAFPALALLAARVWDEAIEGATRATPARTLLLPLLGLFALVTAALVSVLTGLRPVGFEALAGLDVTALARAGVAIFALATAALGVAAWRRATALGVGVALAATIAFLPAVVADARDQLARARSVRPLTAALVQRLTPGDVVMHEGALETSASLLLVLKEPVRVVNGLQPDLAFGATLAEARDIFWDSPRLERVWVGPTRAFLISSVDPGRSVVRALPPASVHLIAQAGGRRLYSNLADRGPDVR